MRANGKGCGKLERGTLQCLSQLSFRRGQEVVAFDLDRHPLAAALALHQRRDVVRRRDVRRFLPEKSLVLLPPVEELVRQHDAPLEVRIAFPKVEHEHAVVPAAVEHRAGRALHVYVAGDRVDAGHVRHGHGGGTPHANRENRQHAADLEQPAPFEEELRGRSQGREACEHDERQMSSADPIAHGGQRHQADDLHERRRQQERQLTALTSSRPAN